MSDGLTMGTDKIRPLAGLLYSREEPFGVTPHYIAEFRIEFKPPEAIVEAMFAAIPYILTDSSCIFIRLADQDFRGLILLKPHERGIQPVAAGSRV